MVLKIEENKEYLIKENYYKCILTNDRVLINKGLYLVLVSLDFSDNVFIKHKENILHISKSNICQN